MKAWCLLGRTEEHHENVILPDILTTKVRNSSYSTIVLVYCPAPNSISVKKSKCWNSNIKSILTLILLTWRIWWAPNNASRWQMGFNSAFKGLIIYFRMGLRLLPVTEYSRNTKTQTQRFGNWICFLPQMITSCLRTKTDPVSETWCLFLVFAEH